MCPKFWTHGHISHQPLVSHVVTNVSTGHILGHIPRILGHIGDYTRLTAMGVLSSVGA